jgi:hypothetical protein
MSQNIKRSSKQHKMAQKDPKWSETAKKVPK